MKNPFDQTILLPLTTPYLHPYLFTRVTVTNNFKKALKGVIKKPMLKMASPAPNFKDKQVSSANEVSKQDAYRNLDSFTVFPDLPTEMRLKIWRSAFPPARHLKLDLSHHFSESTVSPDNMAMKEDEHEPPVTLLVNRESREETLKHYTVVWRTDAICPTKPYTEKPFCIYPVIDSVYFFSQWIYTENADIIQLCNWLGHLQSSLPEGINSFRDIEFLDDRWGSHQEPILSLSPPSPQAWSVLLPNILKVFPALEHLCASLGSSLEGFTYHRGLRKWLHSEHGRKATRRMMKQWLTEGALEDSRKVPKLTLRSWKAPSRDSLLQSTIEHFEERIIILRTIE